MTYWSNVLDTRLTRRRALVGTGITAASAAFLAACGGSSKNSSSSSSGDSKNKSSLLYTLVDETKQAKRGGTYISVQANGIAQGIDPHTIGAHTIIGQRVYSQLFRISDGVMKQTDGTPQG